MRLAYVVSYVEDVHASLEFYERTFGLRRRYLEAERHYSEPDTGGTILAFVSWARAAEHLRTRFEAISPHAAPVGIGIVLAVEDVAASFARAVGAGAVPIQAPEPKPWGATVEYVRDRDGLIVELTSEPES